MEWTKNLTELRPNPPQSLCFWLESYMLTRELSQYAPDLHLKRLYEGFKIQDVWVRDIVLVGAGKRFSFARSLVPLETFKAYEDEWLGLGEQFLGQSFIYQKKHERSPFEYRRLRSGLWARRSLFSLFPKGKTVSFLLTEVLLPDLVQLSHTLCTKKSPISIL